MADDDFFLKRDAVGEAGLSAMGEPVPRVWGEGMVVDVVVGGVENGSPGVGAWTTATRDRDMDGGRTRDESNPG